MTIRVVLADDHVILRQGLRALLEDEPDIEVVGEADDGREAIDVVRQTSPDVVLIDLVMPEMDGIAATQVIHQERPLTRVLILSSIEDESAVLAAVRAGARGFVRKNAHIDDIARSIRAAARGEVQLSPADAKLLVREVQEPTQPEHLTGRELQVLQMVTDGLANKEIAWKLRISEKTVKAHVSTILDKFGLQSRTQAAMHGLRLGLVAQLPHNFASSLRAGAGRVVPMERPRRPHVAVAQ